MIARTAGWTAEQIKKTGAKPVWILKIPFVAGTVYLSDRVVTYAGITIKPWIASWGNLLEATSESLEQPMVSDFAVDIIIDPDEATTIHGLLWSEKCETINCELYLWFEGLTVATNPMILRWTGNIIDFEKVNELLYRVELVDQGVKWDRHPGRVLSLANYPNASLDDVGYQMPIGYGALTNVPCLRLALPKATHIGEDIDGSATSFDLTEPINLENVMVQIGDEKILILGMTGATVDTSVRGMSNKGSGVFVPTPQAMLAGCKAICGGKNGDVYACVYGGDIYKQTAGEGAFNALSQTSRNWSGLAIAENGDVYACVYGGDIYKQTAGEGAFTSLSVTTRNYSGIAINPVTGDIYVSVDGGTIYKDTAGDLNFVDVGDVRSWQRLAAGENGDIYAASNTVIYRQQGGAGSFIAIATAPHFWIAMAVGPEGNVFATEYDGAGVGLSTIYVQIRGVGGFVPLPGQPTLDGPTYYPLGGIPGGSVYTGVDRFYRQNDSFAAHKIGETVIPDNAPGVMLFLDHPAKSISRVLRITPEGDLGDDVTAACTAYTGQSGDTLTEYAGMAVVVAPVSATKGDRFLISGEGYRDDGAGTFTGTPNSLITRPDHIFKHFLYTYSGLPVANFITDAAASFASKSYAFSVVINRRQKIRAWCAEMALQCRCWFRFANGKAHLLYRPDSLVSDKTIAKFADNEDYTTTMRITRSPLDEIINKLTLHYKRDWSKDEGRLAYQAVTTAFDATSITAYGEKENPDLFLFDFVTIPAMAVDLRDFYLARLKDRKRNISGDLFLDNFELEFADAVTITEAGGMLCEIRKAGCSPGSAVKLDVVTIEAREY